MLPFILKTLVSHRFTLIKHYLIRKILQLAGDRLES
jgi:hypothetical protein